jgi:leucyl/phenylalanyl-tRNA--protein transferase
MGWVFDPETADEQGLVGVGADLEPETLLNAYAHGVFPTRFAPYDDPSLPMFWWSPDPRAVIELDSLHLSRRLIRKMRTGMFRISYDLDFSGVLAGCADRAEGTWLTDDMVAAYERLHQIGHAHSVEVWHEQSLAGGTYGVSLGGLFAAESMFHRVTDASKVALAALVSRLTERGFTLLDIQMMTPHTQRMGAVEITRAEYLRRLAHALTIDTTF